MHFPRGVFCMPIKSAPAKMLRLFAGALFGESKKQGRADFSSTSFRTRNEVYCKGKIRTSLLRHLLRALPFIVFAIRGYCRILFAATHPKILPQKVQSNQKLYILRSDKAKSAARAVWHGQGLQQWITAKWALLIGFVLLPYSKAEESHGKGQRAKSEEIPHTRLRLGSG